MDPSLFQFDGIGRLNAPIHFSKSGAFVSSPSFLRESQKPLWPKRGGNPFGHDWMVVNIKLFHKLFSRKALILMLTPFMIATSAHGQSPANNSPQTTPQSQSAAEINQRLQQMREKMAGTATGSEASGESRIGPDDLLNISVFEAPEMNCAVRVSSNGDISLQLLGPVHAAGLTPRELETVLQGLLSGTYMKDPHVGVFVQELQSHGVSVVGAVKMPGVFQIRGTKTVIEILSMAGGLADDAGDTVLILRGPIKAESGNSDGTNAARTEIAPEQVRDGALAKIPSSQNKQLQESPEIEQINLKKLLDSADFALNATVRPGDIVKVPRAGIVYVVGEVNKPGGFVLQNNENISLLQALALAEGPTHTSAIGRARIIRTDPSTGNRIEIPTNIGKVFSGKAPDTFLQPKDIVFVPNSAAKNVFYKGSQAALQTAAGVAIYRW
jgi:polysaccharide export outer membrane protein